MNYSPYYPSGWASGEAGATPITPSALNHMEEGIVNALPKSGGAMTGVLTTKGIKLTSGTDYGNKLPTSPAVGQLFFLDADAADELGL